MRPLLPLSVVLGAALLGVAAKRGLGPAPVEVSCGDDLSTREPDAGAPEGLPREPGLKAAQRTVPLLPTDTEAVRASVTTPAELARAAAEDRAWLGDEPLSDARRRDLLERLRREGEGVDAVPAHVLRRAHDLPFRSLLDEYRTAERPEAVAALRGALLASLDAAELRMLLRAPDGGSAIPPERLHELLRGAAVPAASAIEAIPSAPAAALEAWIGENEGDLAPAKAEGERMADLLLARTLEAGSGAGAPFRALDRVVFATTLLASQRATRARVIDALARAPEAVREAVRAAMSAHAELRERWPEF